MEAPEGESNRDKSSSSSSPISVVSNFWKEFDLEEEKSELDEKGLRIAENQENRQKNRAKLAESTRDFKEYQLRCQLRGHEDDVRGICICGNVGIATSSRDRTVRLWSLDPSDERLYSESKILLGHTSFVGPLMWISPNEEYPDGGIVSGGMDTMALVWDLKTGEMVQTLRGHQLPVTGLSLDNGDIVSSSVDCTLRRWRKGQLVESWEAHKAPIQAVIKLPSGELVTGSSDTVLKLWRGSTCTHTFVGHTDTVRGLAVMSGLGILSASHDGSIRLWALSGEVLMEMVGHTSIVYSVDSHASGLIVSSSKDCFTKIWKDGVCVQSIEHPGCVWDAKFLENGDIVTACCDGVVRIWTVKQDKIADPLEVELYFSQLTQHKISRKRVGGLKLEELPGLEALQIPDNPYDAADKWLLKENLPLSYLEQVVAFILQNTGQKDFTLDPSFRDPYTGSSAYVPGQSSNKSASGKPTFKHIPKKGMLAFDMAQFDGILKKISECNIEQEHDLKLSELESENGKMKVELEEFRTEATQSQLFELRAQSDEETATKQSEVNLLMEVPDPIFISYGGSRHTILRLGSTPTEIEVHIPCHFKVPAMLLGCCNGIICLGNYHKMVLWNPCNGTFITIKDTPSLGSYGFGYTEDDYYLIKVLPTILTKPRGGFGHTKVAKVEFFAVQSKSWTTIHLSDDTFEICGNEWGRFVEGKLYWKGLGSSQEKSGVVICFDLKKKRFQNFGLPKEAITMENVSLAVLSNQICMSLFNPVENKVILWLLKDGGVWETLSIIEEAAEYSFTASFIPLCMSKDERAVLMVESGVEMIGFPIHKKEKPTKTILHSSKSSPLGSRFILSECAFEATCFKESAVCLGSGRDRQKEIVESAERATKQSEVNLLMDEVEQARTRLLSLEREKGLLRFKLDTANEDTENKKSDTSDSYSILENSLIAKEKIIAELNMELHNIETTLSSEREEHLNEIKKLNALLIEKEAALEEMKKELQGRPTTKLVDDLRKKVKILQGYSSKDKKGILFDDWDLSEARSTEVSENADQKHVSLDQDQKSMLICKQRDRFRTRLIERQKKK
ncbi:hypothetical protein ACE6H2_027095 [Prunus campanulata]